MHIYIYTVILITAISHGADPSASHPLVPSTISNGLAVREIFERSVQQLPSSIQFSGSIEHQGAYKNWPSTQFIGRLVKAPAGGVELGVRVKNSYASNGDGAIFQSQPREFAFFGKPRSWEKTEERTGQLVARDWNSVDGHDIFAETISYSDMLSIVSDNPDSYDYDPAVRREQTPSGSATYLVITRYPKASTSEYTRQEVFLDSKSFLVQQIISYTNGWRRIPSLDERKESAYKYLDFSGWQLHHTKQGSFWFPTDIRVSWGKGANRAWVATSLSLQWAVPSEPEAGLDLRTWVQGK